jgi:hypothetical protein
VKFRIVYYYGVGYEGYYGETRHGNSSCWQTITKRCITKWGCKNAIKNYFSRIHPSEIIEEFELN